MLRVKIEKWSYATGLNKTTAWSHQAHVEDDYGTWIETGPVRDTPEQAQEDADRMRRAISERGIKQA